jgi:hypothetical protein
VVLTRSGAKKLVLVAEKDFAEGEGMNAAAAAKRSSNSNSNSNGHGDYGTVVNMYKARSAKRSRIIYNKPPNTQVCADVRALWKEERRARICGT